MFGGERWDFRVDEIFAKNLGIKMEDVRHKKWEAEASRKAWKLWVDSDIYWYFWRRMLASSSKHSGELASRYQQNYLKLRVTVGDND